MKGKVLMLYASSFCDFSSLSRGPLYISTQFHPDRHAAARVLMCGKVEMGREGDARHQRRSCNSCRPSRRC